MTSIHIDDRKKVSVTGSEPIEKYRPDQMRVPAGNPDGGEFVPEHGDELRPLIRENGGFTYDPYDQQSPRVGKMLSIYPDRTKVYNIVPARDELDRFVARNADLLKKPNHYFGAWKHRGRVYLDVAIVVRSDVRMQQLGRRYDQLAAYDLATHKEISITRKVADSGTGDAHPWSPDEAEIRRTLRPADKYRPDQERDEGGRWVDEGGVAYHVTSANRVIDILRSGNISKPYVFTRAGVLPYDYARGQAQVRVVFTSEVKTEPDEEASAAERDLGASIVTGDVSVGNDTIDHIEIGAGVTKEEEEEIRSLCDDSGYGIPVVRKGH